MSETGREWRFYVDDMIAFAENVENYTKGLGPSDFIDNRLIYDATLRNLELIGEAATHIPGEVREANPATRNRLIHAYLGIDDDTAWSIIRDDIPGLLAQLRRLQNERQARR